MLVFIGPDPDSLGLAKDRGYSDETRAKFFQAIEDGKPARVEQLQGQYTRSELKNYISEMEKCGCHQEADLARSALKRK